MSKRFEMGRIMGEEYDLQVVDGRVSDAPARPVHQAAAKGNGAARKPTGQTPAKSTAQPS